jgi:hypothetical protein
VLKKKSLGHFSNNYRTFYQKNCQKALKNMVLGSGIRKKPIPDPGVKKEPDPGSATPIKTVFFLQSEKKLDPPGIV